MRLKEGCVASRTSGRVRKHRFISNPAYDTNRPYSRRRLLCVQTAANNSVPGKSQDYDNKVASNLQVRVATPVDYWACADINVRVFYAGTHRDTSKQGTTSSSSDSDSEDQPSLASSTKHLLSDVKRVLDTLERVDSVQTFTTNDEIQARGFGK